ncbi:ATP-binding protein [Melittangium boletus]|uniref:ATP-binding protein n=1 Tax=Melittangium boletus TaxID=83453 RepID=UPI0012FEADDE|nr:ATP-binding protein [Melittangium boletus]
MGINLIRHVYEKFDLSKLLELQEAPEGKPSASHAPLLTLRSQLDHPGFRKKLSETTLLGDHGRKQVCGFELCLYFHLSQEARGVHTHTIKPAESIRNYVPVLDPATFEKNVRKRWKKLAPASILPAQSPEMQLALFVLAFGLLQPNDAPALIRPLLSLGPQFNEFFKVRTSPHSTTPAAPAPGQRAPLLVHFPPLAEMAKPAAQEKKVPPPSLTSQPPPRSGPQQGATAHAEPTLPRAQATAPTTLSPIDVGVLALPTKTLEERVTAFEHKRKELQHRIKDAAIPCTPEAATMLSRLQDSLTSCGNALAQVQPSLDAAVAGWRGLRKHLAQLDPTLPSEPVLPTDFLGLRDLLASEVPSLQTRIEEHWRCHDQLGQRLQQATMKLDGSMLGSDGALVSEALQVAREALATHRLEEAAHGMDLFSTRLDEAVKRLTAARQRLTEARGRAEQARKDAADAGLLDIAPLDAIEVTTAAEHEDQAQRLERWSVDLEGRLKAKRREETAPKTESTALGEEPTLIRPTLEEDEILRKASRGQKTDVWEALGTPDAVPPLHYLERLYLFATSVAEADKIFDVIPMEGGDANARSGRAAVAGWLWTHTRKGVELSGLQLAAAARLCQALVEEREVPAAFVLANCLGVTSVMGSILDALYLEAASRGAAARARLLAFVPRWEPSGQPLPTTPRAWLAALAMVEAALAAPGDLELTSRATALIHALPGNPPDLAALLTEALTHKQLPGAVPKRHSGDLAEKLRAEFTETQRLQDRWSNHFLREHEDTVIEQVRSLLEAISQARTPAALEVLEFPDMREKKLRAAVRREQARGKEDPTADGSRFKKFTDQLTHYVQKLQEVKTAKLAELTAPSRDNGARERLLQHLPMLLPHTTLVARCLLAGLAAAPGPDNPVPGKMDGDPQWEPEWFTRPGLLRGLEVPRAQTRAQRLLLARHLLERIVEACVDEKEQRIIEAYFAARRGDLRACTQPLNGMEQPFVRALAVFNQQRRLNELGTLVTLANELLEQATAEEYDAAPVAQLVDDLRRRLHEKEPGDIDLEEAMRLLSEAKVGVNNRAEQNLNAAHKLHTQIVALEGEGRLQSPQARRCLMVGKAALADKRFVVALEAFRLVIDHDAAPEDAQGKSAIKSFLDKAGHFAEVGEEGPTERSSTLQQLLTRLEQDMLQRRQDCFDVTAVEPLLAEARLLEATELEALASTLEQAKERLAQAPLSDEPPGLAALLQPPETPRIQEPGRFAALQREYTSCGADRTGVARRLEILAEISVPRGLQRTAFLAELARVRALAYAYAGDGDAARQCCEVLFFLQRRWGSEWAQKKVGALRPPEDPLNAVVLLVSTHLIVRIPEEHRGVAAEWLAKTLGSGPTTPEHMKAALAADTARDHLARLLNVCWMLPADDSEPLMVASLRRMTLWEENAGWLAESLAGLLRTEADVNARRQLGYLLTNHIAKDHEWTLNVLDHLARSGRSDEVMPLGEQQTWNLIRRNLATFGRSIGAQRAAQRDQLLRLLLVAQRNNHGKSFVATLHGIQQALVEMNVPSDPPELHVYLEETHATVDGTAVDFVLALENRGSDIIHEMRIVSQSQSQIIVGEDEPLVLDELLNPRQINISQIKGRLRSADENSTTALGLRITYRGHDDRAYEKLLNVIIPKRSKAAIPVLERRTLKQLFSESGNEVSKVGRNFFGRERELDELQFRLLDQELPEGLVLRGMRRIGKTSLARVFLEQARAQGAVTAFVDFKQYSGQGDNQQLSLAPWRMCSFLATRILEGSVEDKPLYMLLGYKGFQWKEQIHKEFSDSRFPSDLLRGMLEEVARQIDPNPMIVVVDELDYLVNYWEKAESRQYVYDFFNMMRSLLSPGGGPLRSFRWLLSGSDRCASMFGDYQNPLLGSITQLSVHSMTREECTKLLTAPFWTLAGRPITITQAALREVYEVTGGFPFFVQLLGSRLCNVLLERPSDLVSRWHVREAVRRSLPSDGVAEAAAPYDKVLEPIKDHPDHPLLEYLLSLIARRTTDEEPRVRFEDVLQLSEEQVGTRLSRSRVMGLCKLLDTYKMIVIEDENGRLYYRIRFPLVRRLVQTKYDYSPAVTKELALRHLNHVS